MDSKETWIIDPSTWEHCGKEIQLKKGPSLNTARFHHSCGLFHLENSLWIIVAGGTSTNSEEFLNSVELLELTSNSSTENWISGN